MTADDENPVVRWHAVRDWYLDYAHNPHCDFVLPMVDLAAWIAEQPWAAKLFPCTSLAALCVSLKRGYNPDSPFFSCLARDDRTFEFELWAKVGQLIERQRFPVTEGQAAFWNFVRRLEGVE
jgi:hypothetical protein